MKASPNLIGIGAGLVAAVLFASLANNSALAFLLFYLTPLPVLLAAMGWGVRAALLAFVSATSLLALVLSVRYALGFALIVGVPGFILSYLMLLRRHLPAGDAAEAAGGRPLVRTEWYPFGWIIAWASVMAGGLVTLALLLIGGDGESYRQMIGSVFDEAAMKQLQSMLGSEFDQVEFQQFVERFSRYVLPAFASTFWLLIMVGNLWLAAKSAVISGLLDRPVPDFTKIDYPLFISAGFMIALALNFSSGLIGLIGTAFLGAFACANLLLGLAVVHVLVGGLPLKLFFLLALYAGLILTPWVGLPVTVLGLLEPFLRLRWRHSQQFKPPGNNSDSNI
jgi:hypothetical protein